MINVPRKVLKGYDLNAVQELVNDAVRDPQLMFDGGVPPDVQSDAIVNTVLNSGGPLSSAGRNTFKLARKFWKWSDDYLRGVLGGQGCKQ